MMRNLLEMLICAKHLKQLSRYNLLLSASSLKTQEAAQLAVNLLPVKPKYIFDGGFHQGWFTNTLSTIYPDIEVCACDPVRHPIKDSLPSSVPMEFFTVAVSDFEGSAELKLANDPQLHSLLTYNEIYADAFGRNYFTSDQTHIVTVSTIDKLVSKMKWKYCDLLKLDLQGNELAALRGARETLVNTRAVYLEVSFVEVYAGQPLFCEIDAMLQQIGFRLSKILNPRGGKFLLQADALYFNTSVYN